MKISLLIPTRDRAKLFDESIESIWLNTTHKKNLELMIACDDDDLSSQGYVKLTMDRYPTLDYKLVTRPRSEFSNRDYYNFLAERSTGDLVMAFADDLMVTSPGWDEAIIVAVNEAIKKFPDKIFCVSVRDNTPPPSHRIPKFPCFPMLTREAIKALGFFLHPSPPNWGVDFINFKIFEPIGRMVEVHDRNYINHVSWHTKLTQIDSTNQRIGQIFNRLKMIPMHNTDRILQEEVVPLRHKLIEAINNFKSSCNPT